MQRRMSRTFLREETSASTDLKTPKSVFLMWSYYKWGNKRVFSNGEWWPHQNENLKLWSCWLKPYSKKKCRITLTNSVPCPSPRKNPQKSTIWREKHSTNPVAGVTEMTRKVTCVLMSGGFSPLGISHWWDRMPTARWGLSRMLNAGPSCLSAYSRCTYISHLSQGTLNSSAAGSIFRFLYIPHNIWETALNLADIQRGQGTDHGSEAMTFWSLSYY